MCKECQLGKLTKSTFKSKIYSSNGLLDLVHTNLCGPTMTRRYYGDKYFILFIDDYSRMIWVTFLKEKSEAFDKFKIFRAMVETETGLKMKCLRLDRGGEFTSGEFNTYCEEDEIKRRMSAPRTPQQNWIVERRNKTILDSARTMMMEGKVSQMY